MHVNLWAYAMKATLQWRKFLQNQTHAIIESHEISQSILMATSQYFTPYNSLYIFSEIHLTFSTVIHGNEILPQVGKGVTTGTQKELI